MAEGGLLMIKNLNIKEHAVAKKVLSLQMISYRVEAELLDFEDIPPLNETISQLQKCGEVFNGCFKHDELVGAISFKLVEDKIDIDRPSHGTPKRV
jgi:hypothetical protein